MSTNAPRSRLQDTGTGYGWISIALHWAATVVVLALLFVGSSISSAEPMQRSAVVKLHVSIAVVCYALLWWRVAWRFVKGHPGPLPQQRRTFFLIGKYAHLAMLAAIACMLVMGPLMVWSGGGSLGAFGWFEIPSPFAAHHALRDSFHTIHATTAVAIGAAVVLHLGGVYKHAAFDQDGTFGKMLVASSAPAAHTEPSGENGKTTTN